MKEHHLNRRGYYVHPMASKASKPKVLRGTGPNNTAGAKPMRMNWKPSRRQLERMRSR